MKILVVGDVHGCVNTFKILLDRHWNREEELLIQVGDLIDRGNFSPQTLLFVHELNMKTNACFLKGNHEYELLKHFSEGPNENWIRQGGNITLSKFQECRININEYLKWLTGLPLKWENENVLITHAGISADVKDPFDEADKKGVLWNRGILENTGRIQIHGHTPTKSRKPEFTNTTNSWNIDSGAYLHHGLSALKISESGEVLEIIHVDTFEDDVT